METVTAERRGAELRITLNRPDAMNSWDKQLALDLRDAVSEASADDGVRVVVLTGAGRAFSAGADLKAGFEQTPAGHPDVGAALRERYHPIILGLRRMPKPVIAAVNGPAAGIGCSLALAADLIVARESAYFLLAFVNIALVPDGGSSFFVPERIGQARAAEMAMLGERIPARRALEWGLINRVTPDGGLEAAVDELAARLAAGPTRVHARTKQLVNAWHFERMEAQLELEATLQVESAESPDFAEGVRAFVEKRPAAFEGR